MSPSHLAQPGRQPQQEPIDAAVNAVIEATVKLDRSTGIFVDLIRIRREQARTRWWQFSTRRRLTAKIAALKAEQAAL